MNRFLAGAAVLFLMFMILLLATDKAGNRAVLSTVEYAVAPDIAVADRAAERAHTEEMARIEAQRLVNTEQQRTDRMWIIGGVLAVAFASAALASTAMRPKTVYMLPDGMQGRPAVEDRTGGVTVVEGEAYRPWLEVRK